MLAKNVNQRMFHRQREWKTISTQQFLPNPPKTLLSLFAKNRRRSVEEAPGDELGAISSTRQRSTGSPRQDLSPMGDA